eukprot:scaffold4186_cov103-Alexandrium_tamarense.AAC.11
MPIYDWQCVWRNVSLPFDERRRGGWRPLEGWVDVRLVVAEREPLSGNRGRRIELMLVNAAATADDVSTKGGRRLSTTEATSTFSPTTPLTEATRRLHSHSVNDITSLSPCQFLFLRGCVAAVAEVAVVFIVSKKNR